MQSVKVGADSTFMCSLWSFPEYWRVLLKGHFVTGSRAFGGLLGYWVVLLESLVWVPVVIFGELLSSLFPAERCGGSVCTALLRTAREGSWVESQHRTQRCSLGCCQGLPGAQGICTTWVQSGAVLSPCAAHGWNWIQESSARPPSCVCLAFHWRSVQRWGGLLTWGTAHWFHCRVRKWSQASAGHMLVCVEALGCASFAVLLQHQQLTGAERDVLFTFCLISELPWGL